LELAVPLLLAALPVHQGQTQSLQVLPQMVAVLAVRVTVVLVQ
jgi:ribosome biogenesis protein Tsr3